MLYDLATTTSRITNRALAHNRRSSPGRVHPREWVLYRYYTALPDGEEVPAPVLLSASYITFIVRPDGAVWIQLTDDNCVDVVPLTTIVCIDG